MRKITAILALAVFLLILPNGVIALKSPVSLFVNGEEVMEELPVLFQDQQLYVPIERIAEHIGLNSTWDEVAQKGILQDEDRSMRLEYDVSTASVTINDESIETSETVQFGEAGPFIPVRWIEEMNGMKVLWDVFTRSVFIFMNGVDPYDTIDESTVMFPEEVEENRAKVAVTGFRMDDDRVAITLNGAADPSSMYLSDAENGDRLVIDIPNSRVAESLLNEQGHPNGEYVTEHPYVDQIRYSLFDADTDTIRFVFDFKEKVQFHEHQNYETNEIILDFITDASYTVVIDPGHGGSDPGTIGASGEFESEFSLNMAFKIKKLLEQDSRVQVVLTRTDDEFISLEDRAQFANDYGADLFVSVHGNSFDSMTKGTETFYYGADSKDFASEMHKWVQGATEFKDRGIKEEKYRVLNLTHMTAVLLEIGYLDHPVEEAVMLSEEFQDRVAKSIVDGIVHYLE